MRCSFGLGSVLILFGVSCSQGNHVQHEKQNQSFQQTNPLANPDEEVSLALVLSYNGKECPKGWKINESGTKCTNKNKLLSSNTWILAEVPSATKDLESYITAHRELNQTSSDSCDNLKKDSDKDVWQRIDNTCVFNKKISRDRSHDILKNICNVKYSGGLKTCELSVSEKSSSQNSHIKFVFPNFNEEICKGIPGSDFVNGSCLLDLVKIVGLPAEGTEDKNTTKEDSLKKAFSIACDALGDHSRGIRIEPKNGPTSNPCVSPPYLFGSPEMGACQLGELLTVEIGDQIYKNKYKEEHPLFTWDDAKKECVFTQAIDEYGGLAHPKKKDPEEKKEEESKMACYQFNDASNFDNNNSWKKRDDLETKDACQKANTCEDDSVEQANCLKWAKGPDAPGVSWMACYELDTNNKTWQKKLDIETIENCRKEQDSCATPGVNTCYKWAQASDKDPSPWPAICYHFTQNAEDKKWYWLPSTETSLEDCQKADSCANGGGSSISAPADGNGCYKWANASDKPGTLWVEKEACYWKSIQNGLWSLMPSQKSFEDCKNMDSCSPNGGKASRGGCYKWSLGPDGEGTSWTIPTEQTCSLLSVEEFKKTITENNAQPFKIKKAWYGVESKNVDETAFLQTYADRGLFATPIQMNEFLGKDPVEGIRKTLSVDFEIKGKCYSVSIPEGSGSDYVVGSKLTVDRNTRITYKRGNSSAVWTNCVSIKINNGEEQPLGCNHDENQFLVIPLDLLPRPSVNSFVLIFKTNNMLRPNSIDPYVEVSSIVSAIEANNPINIRNKGFRIGYNDGGGSSFDDLVFDLTSDQDLNLKIENCSKSECSIIHPIPR